LQTGNESTGMQIQHPLIIIIIIIIIKT